MPMHRLHMSQLQLSYRPLYVTHVSSHIWLAYWLEWHQRCFHSWNILFQLSFIIITTLINNTWTVHIFFTSYFKQQLSTSCFLTYIFYEYGLYWIKKQRPLFLSKEEKSKLAIWLFVFLLLLQLGEKLLGFYSLFLCPTRLGHVLVAGATLGSSRFHFAS